MKTLLSLPPNLVNCFHDVEQLSRDTYFCTSDPVGSKLGSGGGTTWLLRACHQAEADGQDFLSWLGGEKRILLHAGGQSRRLPGYAPSGKILTPIPVFKWERGQRITQNLLQLQLPLYERIMQQAPDSLHTLVASGDVYIRAGKLQPVPQADVVCYGLWVDPSLATNHGVFVSERSTPGVLDFMLQKPSVERLGQLMHTHLFLMDVGIWLLSDRAVRLLAERSTNRDGHTCYYDMYSDFGCSLGAHPTLDDPELASLSVAILPLDGGQFYHFGTSRELISSTVSIQNSVFDQRQIVQLGIKPHPSIFVQNAHCEAELKSTNENTWIENSWVGKDWTLHSDNIITGIPRNDWHVTLPKGACVDMVYATCRDAQGYVLRCYGLHDAFRGALSDPSVSFLGQPVTQWLSQHGLTPQDIEGNDDLQAARLFPISQDMHQLGCMLRWMIWDATCDEGKNYWLNCTKLSANEISDFADLKKLQEQRRSFLRENLVQLAVNHKKSVFYQTNLAHMAEEFHALDLPMPDALPETEPLLKRINDQMFRSQLLRLNGQDGSAHEQSAFQLLRDGLTEHVLAHKQFPRLGVYRDQIVWGRSPVRIDLAGGWTDTPPYCLLGGGNVVNIAIELNGQPPLQTYIKPSRDYRIVLRSIDLGAVEYVETFEQLRCFAQVGSPFSIPKAALALAGFLPEFCTAQYSTLADQLHDFGCGIEVTLLSAVPAGSGLGTSSILASTVLGAINDFCALHWDRMEIGNRTLVLEQLLTTGGGWQDQFGGILPGAKLLRTAAGFDQSPDVRWLSTTLFNAPEYAPCHLLYYTGITRTAKTILAEIVRGMFLYDTRRMTLLSEMKEHALDMYEAILRGDFDLTGRLVRKSWEQNKALDSGTNPPAVQAIVQQVDDLCAGYKLPGAGGGGFLYMVAKDAEAAQRIRHILTSNPPNECARFVDMHLSDTGLQISRS